MKNLLIAVTLFLTNILTAGSQTLFGTTQNAGNGAGTIFKLLPSTSDFSVSNSFERFMAHPSYLKMVEGNDGKLYGTTASGGSYNFGVIFSFEPLTSTFAIVKDFNGLEDGSYPAGTLIKAADGKLYGINSSVLYSFEPLSGTFTTLKNFSTSEEFYGLAGIMQATDGKLYGMANYGGVYSYGAIFSFDPSTSTYAKLFDFDNTNGASPYGTLCQASDGLLYGMTYGGGSNARGVMFSIDPLSQNFIKLKDFDNSTGNDPYGNLIQASDGKLYGMNTHGGSSDAGVIFNYDPQTSEYTILKDFDFTDGAYSSCSLIQAIDGKIYGMANGGANSSNGVIFSFDISPFTFTKLKEFTFSDGAYPTGSLMQASNGKLYGVTSNGGSGSGVIFSYDPLLNSYTLLKSLGTNYSGSFPTGKLTLANNGKLYGMTTYGGSLGYGVMFSFDPSTSVIIKIKDFDKWDGGNPYGGLIKAADGKLYGMTGNGGAYFSGVIFSFDPSTNSFTKVYDFDNTNGAFSFGSLMQATDGKFYGLTSGGGSSYAGVIFSFDPSSLAYAKLKEFNYDDGGFPQGNLMQATDGKLYGMTTSGGNAFGGVIFSFDPLPSVYTKLKDFNDADGNYPSGSLIQAKDGKLYGITGAGGSNQSGVVFSFDATSGTYTKLKEFNGVDGLRPFGSLMQASDQNLYGTTIGGGTNSLGVVFSLNPVSSTYTKLKDLDDASGANPFIGSELVELNDCTLPITYYKDADGDGYGDVSSPQSLCAQPAGYVIDNSDCDDTNAEIHPGATEICNGLDDNCDGQVDEGLLTTFYRDGDGDGYGDVSNTILLCSVSEGYVSDYTDCNDLNAEIHPGAIEVCNGVDDNCDGIIDENVQIRFYKDADGDGYGSESEFLLACSQPQGYVINNYDCNDNNNGNKAGDATVKMCHKGNTLCVKIKEVEKMAAKGWILGNCSNVQNSLSYNETKKPVTYLLTNHPNPFKGTTTIQYELPMDSKVSIKVYDVTGRVVTTLVDDNKKAGVYAVDFKGNMATGGVLFYRMIAISKEYQFRQTNKVVQLK